MEVEEVNGHMLSAQNFPLPGPRGLGMDRWLPHTRARQESRVLEGAGHKATFCGAACTGLPSAAGGTCVPHGVQEASAGTDRDPRAQSNTYLTVGGLLQALLGFIHEVFFLKIQVTLELDQSLEN